MDQIFFRSKLFRMLRYQYQALKLLSLLHKCKSIKRTSQIFLQILQEFLARQRKHFRLLFNKVDETEATVVVFKGNEVLGSARRRASR